MSPAGFVLFKARQNARTVYTYAMKKIVIAILVLVVLAGFSSTLYFMNASKAQAAPAAILVVPETVLQGEPIKITIEGINSVSEIKKLTFDGKETGVFLYNSKPTAFYGIALEKKAGTSTLIANLSDGRVLRKDILIVERKKAEAPLGIPQKLGGDTPASQKNLVDTLSIENAVLNKLTTDAKFYWNKKFIFPIANPIITDPYGYLRKTGAYSITHKGTDFHANKGTPVIAMNRGVVRLAKQFKIYGNTVVIDHGYGLMTFYMHLSKINVKQGDIVEQGKIIAESGDTGYADQPHLHLTVRLNNTSIDPIKFLALFK
jgi:murein DD-endopeptidase MepM/ murein hydrolase activator NlpD